jgi:hypothetical protein
MAKKGAALQGSVAKRPKRLTYEERQRVGGCAVHFCNVAVPGFELTVCSPAGRGARGASLSGRQHHCRARRGRRCSAHRQPRFAGEHARCPSRQTVKPVLGTSLPFRAPAAPRHARCWGQEAGRGGAEAADAGEDEDADAAALVWEDRTGAAPALAQRPADADADAEPASSADGEADEEAAGAPRYESSEDGDADEDRGAAGGASGGSGRSLDVSEEDDAGEDAAATAAAPGPQADERPGEGADGGARTARLHGPRAAWEDRAGGGGGAAPAARRPVWEDPDDASQAVNVAGRNRLRKLRRSEDESVLTGARSATVAGARRARRLDSCGAAVMCTGAWQRGLGSGSGR